MFQECSEADHKVHYWRKVRREEGGRKGGRRREEEGGGGKRKSEREKRMERRRIRERKDIQINDYDHACTYIMHFICTS